MYLNNKRVLRIVDTATNVQNALIIRSKSTEDLWQYFLTCWETVYIGFPATIRLDRESSFTSENFRNHAKYVDFSLQSSGI